MIIIIFSILNTILNANALKNPKIDPTSIRCINIYDIIFAMIEVSLEFFVFYTLFIAN